MTPFPVGSDCWFIHFDWNDPDHHTSVPIGVVIQVYGSLRKVLYGTISNAKTRWIWVQRLQPVPCKQGDVEAYIALHDPMR